MKRKVIVSIVWWSVLFFSAQYYLLFPAVFTNDLNDEFSLVDKNIKIKKENYFGNNLRSIYFKSKEEEPKLVIFLHGNYETIDQNFMSILAITEAKSDILMLEYPGYSSSTGWPTPTNILKSQLSAISKVKNPNQRLVIWGRSLGGGIAMNLAINIEYDKLILESTFLHPANYIGDNIFGDLLKHLFIFDLSNEDKFDKLKSHQSPILLIHCLLYTSPSPRD